MTSFLTNFTDEIESYVQWATSTTGNVFQLISLTGKCLLQTISLLLETVHIFSLFVAEGISVFFHEFILFLLDINDLSDTLLKFLNNTGNYTCQVLISSFNSLGNLGIQIRLLFSAAITDVWTVLTSTLVNAKSLLILIGNSTLFLVQLGPSIVCFIFYAPISLTSWVVQTVLLYTSQSIFWTVALIQCILYEILDMPTSSLFGMFLAIFILIGFRFYLKSICWLFYWQKTRALITKWLHALDLKRPSMLLQGVKFKKEAIELDDHSNRHLLRQLEIEREDKLCVICHDRFKCVLLLPCRHFCLCQICIDIVRQTDPNCPLCRKYVTDSLRVYC